MHKIIYTLILLFILISETVAQSSVDNIIDDLNMPKVGQGSVKVMQDESIKKLLASPRSLSTDSLGNIDWASTDYVRIRGYKIQVFSGNNQTKSKQEAEYKQRQVKEAFPWLETTVTFNAPVWRLRVGNFLTFSEAESTLEKMKSQFPSFGKEMYVVDDVVKRPK